MMRREPTVTPTATSSRAQLAAGLGGSTRNQSPLDQSLTRANKRAASNRSTANLERSVLQQINQYRQRNGLSPLTTNATIAQQARRHSQNMANSRSLNHNGFEARIQTISKTIPYRGAAENVAFNAGFSNPAAQAVNGWLKSSGHLQNIMGNFNLTGIGVAKNSQNEYYFTQIFIQR